MKKILILCSFTGVFAMTASSWAGATDYAVGKAAVGKGPVAPHAALCFQAGELTLDGFAGYTWGRNGGSGAKSIGDGWGGGVGLNYFFTEALGISGRYFGFDNDIGSFQHDVSASLVLRCPMQDSCIAPYVFGGGGLITDTDTKGTGHLGGGIEFRLDEQWGLFVDGRYTWVEKTQNYTSANLGVRIRL